MDEQGTVQTSWEEIAWIVEGHFTKLFGERKEVSEEALERVLQSQTARIPQAAKEMLEAPITLEELYLAAKNLAKKKVPGIDGVPIEFYLSIWDLIGPMLLAMLQEGLQSGSLHPKITEGLIILLVKKGNQLFNGNKHGITLLNCALKILTKLYQIRLSTVLVDFITEQQQAFLPGRLIHRSLLLTNKILQKAKVLPNSFALLKLDTVKAFDCLIWAFLYALLERLGFGPEFI